MDKTEYKTILITFLYQAYRFSLTVVEEAPFTNFTHELFLIGFTIFIRIETKVIPYYRATSTGEIHNFLLMIHDAGYDAIRNANDTMDLLQNRFVIMYLHQHGPRMGQELVIKIVLNTSAAAIWFYTTEQRTVTYCTDFKNVSGKIFTEYSKSVQAYAFVFRSDKGSGRSVTHLISY